MIDDLTNLIGQICLFRSKISEKINATNSFSGQCEQLHYEQVNQKIIVKALNIHTKFTCALCKGSNFGH